MRRLHHCVLGCSLLAFVACTDNVTPPSNQAAAPAPACVPDLDGAIAASEFPNLAATHTTVLSSMAGANPTVDLKGGVDSAGRQAWSFASEALGTTPLEVVALPIASRWYGGDFPAAEFAFSSTDGAFDSVYSQDESGLWLHGIASTLESPPIGQTLIVYAAPVLIYKFPLVRGDAWTAIGEVPAGTFNGFAFSGRDVYEVADDATGYLELADLTFTQAHRVRLTITNEPMLAPATTRRQVSFLFECFGEVTRVTSKLNETAEDFTTADEVRRFTVSGP
ncbi:MAG: hypothetical protein AB7P03_26880 [Kofleriaceae bacterium]